MFSYRHAFHAGNHADVLKHATLIGILQYLVQKEAALTVIDTHAGAGLYRLDGDYATKSGESLEGIGRLRAFFAAEGAPAPAALLQSYLDLVAEFNRAGGANVYPGSPFVSERLLRGHDRLKLFELHPTDARALSGNTDQLDAGRRIAVLREDGFEGVKKFLPPPARRALVLCDPSYEMKSDYASAAQLVGDSLKRFATGTYAVWYPIIGRAEAHDLPRRLRTLANQARKPWLHATLTVKGGTSVAPANLPGVDHKRPGLPASGMFIVNPPFTLREQLAEALPQMKTALEQDSRAAFTLEAGGA
ncbi:23S rRNA (adenine(2030)-N(6))-methyltransferase RlmJ [Xylophilus sp. GOD-11R]|uniref:23S rRNA (adenine(2030)-N(6))-methyltransferase RlmJ n=1 Tax=Xylophilus sp. GOD-11R TaxID=3089814 RepID=UPI00298D02F2|nr:23S rRNA (adenine(2030)-N(6))-methyltransferase RlmJ [Xylophilus sp. GOD-11R]WPB56339.1 23S rRNA (adenine(2030)-N(6))-methyltransferase RlmJ [Xylophilus sp. GOD-11R]